MSLQPVHFFVQLSELVLRGSLCSTPETRSGTIRAAQRKGRAAVIKLRLMWPHLESVEKISQLEQRQLNLVDRVSLRQQAVGRLSDRRARPSRAVPTYLFPVSHGVQAVRIGPGERVGRHGRHRRVSRPAKPCWLATRTRCVRLGAGVNSTRLVAATPRLTDSTSRVYTERARGTPTVAAQP